MPIYEYGCKNCGYEWEEMQRITADPLTDCPECNAPQAQRLISRTSFVLKGSGWYVTDYGRGNDGQPKSSANDNKEKSSESKESSNSTTTSKKSESKD